MLDEKGLLSAIKRAYKQEGYETCHYGQEKGRFLISTPLWFVDMPRTAVPNKVLALIVEHAGDIPNQTGIRCSKTNGAEYAMPEALLTGLKTYTDTKDNPYIELALRYGEDKLYQSPKTLEVLRIDGGFTRIVDRDEGVIPNYYKNTLIWQSDEYCIGIARKPMGMLAEQTSALGSIQWEYAKKS